MPYHVHTVEYSLRSGHQHFALFVEMSDGGTGCIFQVKGELSEGTEYEIKSETRPYLQADFSKITVIGTVSFAKFPLLMQACEDTPPPRRQLDQKGDKIDPEEPLYRCVEWLEDVVLRLKTRGLLEAVV